METQELKFLLKLLEPPNYRAKITEIKLNKISLKERNQICQNLCDRLLVECHEEIQEVCLTPHGKDYLAKEYTPEGNGNITLSKIQLGNYVNFLRDYFSSASFQVEQITTTPTIFSDQQPSDEEILQTIINLDQKLGTDNYLPIFHLRDELQSQLTRNELDQALNRLQKQGKIELGLLAEAIRYTAEQFDTGILQPGGNRLFFIMVN